MCLSLTFNKKGVVPHTYCHQKRLIIQTRDAMKQKRTILAQAKLEDALSSIDSASFSVVKSNTLTTLWAGYGRIVEFEAVDSEGKRRRLILKEVAPPQNEEGVGHMRKLRSYQVEASFYQHLAPRLQQNPICKLPHSLLVKSNLLSGEGEQGGIMVLVLSDLRTQFPRSSGSLDLLHTKAVLRWLAAFHATFWEEPAPTNVWSEGSYWHLDTRQEELQYMGLEWAELKMLAEEIDMQLKGGQPNGDTRNRQFRTLIHGDAKSANILFAPLNTPVDPPECALYDFQYCGGGYGVKDVVYLLVSSVDAKTIEQEEQSLLSYYHDHLVNQLQPEQRAAYTLNVMKQHYQLALLDYVRFMAGWGFWGNASWAKKKAKTYLLQLKEHLSNE